MCVGVEKTSLKTKLLVYIMRGGGGRVILSTTLFLAAIVTHRMLDYEHYFFSKNMQFISNLSRKKNNTNILR